MSVCLRGARNGVWVRVVAFVTGMALLPVCGCSFVFLNRPRDDYKPYEKIDCTTSYALPDLDVALTLVHILSLAILSSATGNSFGGSKERDTLAQGDVFWLVMNGVSGIWGYYKVSECRDLVAEDEGVHMRPVHMAPRPPPAPARSWHPVRRMWTPLDRRRPPTNPYRHCLRPPSRPQRPQPKRRRRHHAYLRRRTKIRVSFSALRWLALPVFALALLAAGCSTGACSMCRPGTRGSDSSQTCGPCVCTDAGISQRLPWCVDGSADGRDK